MSRRQRELDIIVGKCEGSNYISSDEFLTRLSRLNSIDACYIVLKLERGSSYEKDELIDAVLNEV